MSTELKFHEKRALEKMLFDDINKATVLYQAYRRTERSSLIEQLVVNPPRAVRTALRNIERATKAKKLAEGQLAAHGYDLDYHGKLCSSRTNLPKLLIEFDEETDSAEKRLAEAKRSYALKLFAGGEEAKELFASLARELAAIVKQS